MQQVDIKGYVDPATTGAAGYPRFLERAGRLELTHSHYVLGRSCGPYSLWQGESGEWKWRLWGLTSFKWERITALTILQGASLQNAIGPRYALLQGTLSTMYDAVPGIKNAYFIEPLNMPAEQSAAFLAFAYTTLTPVLPPVVVQEA